MRLTPEEAINAVTVNGAAAMQISDRAGSITAGKDARLIITRPMEHLAYLPYAFGEIILKEPFYRQSPDRRNQKYTRTFVHNLCICHAN